MVRPPISWRTLAVFDFMRVPPPAASTITVRSLAMGTNLIPGTGSTAIAHLNDPGGRPGPGPSGAASPVGAANPVDRGGSCLHPQLGAVREDRFESLKPVPAHRRSARSAEDAGG